MQRDMAPVPHLRFQPAEAIGPYLDRFADLGTWLHARGHGVNADQTWADLARNDPDLLAEVARTQRVEPVEAIPDPEGFSISTLIHRLIETHHALLRAELPRLLHLSRLLRHDPLTDIVQSLHDELLAHIDLEEATIFPLCLAVDRADLGVDQPPVGALGKALHLMCEDHHRIDDLLLRAREICATLDERGDATLINDGLAGLASDLHVHLRKESDILLPEVLHLADSVATRLNRPHRVQRGQPWTT